jgi:hypothetical protein
MERLSACNVVGCEQPLVSRWKCADHFARARRLCEVDGCGRKHRMNGLCGMHAQRLRSSGRVGPAELLRVSGRVCDIDGCGKPHQAKGLCGMHYERKSHYGNTDFVTPRYKLPAPPPGSENILWKGDDVGYSAVHVRLKKWRGKPVDQTCACGDTARTWAYDHSDPNEKTSAEGPYSLDLYRYTAMCYSCHTTLDHQRTRTR